MFEHDWRYTIITDSRCHTCPNFGERKKRLGETAYKRLDYDMAFALGPNGGGDNAGQFLDVGYSGRA